MISLLDLIALLFGIRVYCLLIDNGNWRSKNVNGCKAPFFSWFLAHGKQNSLSHCQAKNTNIYFLFIHVWWSSGVCWPWKIRPNSLYPHLGIHIKDISFRIWGTHFHKTTNGLFLQTSTILPQIQKVRQWWIQHFITIWRAGWCPVPSLWAALSPARKEDTDTRLVVSPAGKREQAILPAHQIWE